MQKRKRRLSSKLGRARSKDLRSILDTLTRFWRIFAAYVRILDWFGFVNYYAHQHPRFHKWCHPPPIGYGHLSVDQWHGFTFSVCNSGTRFKKAFLRVKKVLTQVLTKLSTPFSKIFTIEKASSIQSDYVPKITGTLYLFLSDCFLHNPCNNANTFLLALPHFSLYSSSFF